MPKKNWQDIGDPNAGRHAGKLAEQREAREQAEQPQQTPWSMTQNDPMRGRGFDPLNQPQVGPGKFSFFYDQPPALPSSYAQLPNSERLTPTERFLYKALPGFAETSVGKALAAFGDTGLAKALNYLDVAAEGFERGVGLLGQFAQTSSMTPVSTCVTLGMHAHWPTT